MQVTFDKNEKPLKYASPSDRAGRFLASDDAEAVKMRVNSINGMRQALEDTDVTNVDRWAIFLCDRGVGVLGANKLRPDMAFDLIMTCMYLLRDLPPEVLENMNLAMADGVERVFTKLAEINQKYEYDPGGLDDI
jgi:hypothetical protein